MAFRGGPATGWKPGLAPRLRGCVTASTPLRCAQNDRTIYEMASSDFEAAVGPDTASLSTNQ